MSKDSKANKQGFINLFMESIEDNSSNDEKAREFLETEGVNVEKMLSEGIRRIKKLKMMVAAKKTEQEMEKAGAEKLRAVEWVDNLLNNIDFSQNALSKIIQEEGLTVSFRNVESLSKEDIKEILIKHFTLKFMNEKNKLKDGI